MAAVGASRSARTPSRRSIRGVRSPAWRASRPTTSPQVAPSGSTSTNSANARTSSPPWGIHWRPGIRLQGRYEPHHRFHPAAPRRHRGLLGSGGGRLSRRDDPVRRRPRPPRSPRSCRPGTEPVTRGTAPGERRPPQGASPRKGHRHSASDTPTRTARQPARMHPPSTSPSYRWTPPTTYTPRPCGRSLT
jgi:hypothetical protein